MKRKKTAMNMRTKVLLLCSLITLFALSVQAILFQYTSSELVYKQAKESSLKSLQNMQDDFYTFIRSIEINIIKIYNETSFINDLSNGLQYEELRQNYNQTAREIALWNFEPSIKVNALYIYDMDDNLISSYRHASTPIYTYPVDIYDNIEENNAEAVKNYVDSDDMTMLVSSYYNQKRQTTIPRFVLKIYADNVTRKIGYIVCDVDEKNFIRIAEKYLYSQAQLIWLQPAGDHPFILAGNLEDNKSKYYNMITQLVEADGTPVKDTVILDDSVYFEIPQKKYNLSAYSLTPLFLLEESQRVLTRNLFIIAGLTIIIFLIASIILARSLTNPLKNMVTTMNKIKDGNTSLRLTNLKDNEIGRMGDAFNQMLDQIENLVMKEYQSKLLSKQAEYKALQAQVNPHFLYNTLDTMSSIAASQKCDTVSSICMALSNIFRYSIDMEDPLSTIQKEILHIKNYMYVMNTRMGNSINIDVQIKSEFWDISIPRLSIQPLVENSILHGLKNKRGEKTIQVTATYAEKDIILSISDTGIGMDAEKINNKLQSGNYQVLEKSSSIGLENINARVKLLFGEKYGVIVSSAKGKGSIVSLRIPIMKGCETEYEEKI